MMLIQRLRQFLSPPPNLPALADRPVSLYPAFIPQSPIEFTSSNLLSSYIPEPLPNWLADEENLRDEGVFFGLSDARSDEKVAQIQAFFARQAAPLEESVDKCTIEINELNRLIDHHENRLSVLREQSSVLRGSQPGPTNGIRTVSSLLFSILMCIGNFYLVDETLRSAFSNRWIAVGIYLAGMFNLFGRSSFFYEEGTRLTGRRMLAEVSLPLAASAFVLAQALQMESLGQSVALFAFVFCLFLLAGKLLLSNLNMCQTELNTIQANRRLAIDKAQNLPTLEAEMTRLGGEINSIWAQKQSLISARAHTQTKLTQLNTHRDWLVNLFVSEFELARTLRDRLPEQQKTDLLRSYKVVQS